jgi:tRNA A-37 threonylcarbamoyl transferase component Bud32/tetratricopeptide (TPR) repeat protein
MIGTTLSHFRILAKIGEGGMGVVYRAEDERLRRPVALKVLPPDLVGNEERRLRFLREARAAAAVTHPNIATIYEVGEADGVVFIAMELVEGKTLRELIGGRAMPIKDALRVAVEVAEGLARAHQAHVIHRDLKPENIAVAVDGHVKILDFGLAKLLEEHPAAGGPELTRLRTISGEMTQAGKIMGTASYMSPEQARGEVVDARSDIFSFGTMLYEMVAGRIPFQGRTNTDLLSAIIRDEPAPVTALNPGVPAELQRIISQCLEKDPAERYQHTDQLAVDLRKLRRSTSSDVQALRSVGGPMVAARRASTIPRARGTRWLLVGVTVALIAAAGAAGYRRWHRPAPALAIGDRVIVADFVNGTGRAEYDTAVRDAFEQMLSRSAFVDVVSGGALRDLVKAKAKTAVSRIDADLARVLCGDGACGGFFTGGIVLDGDGFKLQAALNLVSEARPVITRSVQAASDQDLLAAIHGLVLDIRRDLGESPRAVAATPLPATRSLPAYAAYALGMDNALSPDKQLPLFKRAIDIDPSFADAYQALALARFNLGDTQGYRKLIEEAYKRSSALPEQLRLRSEILFLDASYDYDGEIESLNSYISLYPFDYIGHRWLGWVYDVPYGDFSSGGKSRWTAFELHPSTVDFINVCQTLAALGKGAEVDRLVEDYRNRRTDADIVDMCRLFAAYGRDDFTGTFEAIKGMEQSGAASTRETAALFKVFALERWGRLDQARVVIGAAEQQALQLGDLDGQQSVAQDTAWLEMRRTSQPPALSPHLGDLASQSLLRLRDLAVTSLESGLTAPLERVIETHAADQKGSKSRFVAEELAFARACLAFVRGQSASARALLEPITRGTLLSVRHHALGRVNESLGLWREAASQYAQALTVSHIFKISPSFWALDQFRLARAYDRLGDTARARQWYTRFTTDWKDADPDIPELIEARQRLQALGGAVPQPAQPAGSGTQPVGSGTQPAGAPAR